jgi:hypothetical protein
MGDSLDDLDFPHVAELLMARRETRRAPRRVRPTRLCPDCETKQTTIDRLRTALVCIRDWQAGGDTAADVADKALRETKP